MPNSNNNWLDKLLNIGDPEESITNLNHKQVVNLALTLLCVTDLVMIFIFAVQQSYSVVSFYVFGLVASLGGFYLQYIRLFSTARMLTLLSMMVQISIPSMYFFGSQSSLHWLFVTVAAYAFTAFPSSERISRTLVTFVAVALFILCEFYSSRGVFLNEKEQRILTIFTFLLTLFSVSWVVNVVINRLRKVNNNLTILSEIDELTGLENRRKLLSNAVMVFTESLYLRQPCVFAILDLDHFKRINDNFGHDAGDLVLTKVAKLMQSALSEGYEIGRYGGEEFVILMRNTTLKEADIKMNTLREIVEGAHVETDKGVVIPVTVSIGLASITERTKRYEDLLSLADAALYEAKKTGRNRVVSQMILS